MIIFDSNVWIALFDHDDNQHEKAVKLFRGSSAVGQLGITEYIILEVCTVLLVKAGKLLVDDFLAKVLDNNDIRVILSSKRFFEEVIIVFRSLDSVKLSFVDASLLVLTRDYKIETFDRELKKFLSKKFNV